MGLGYKQKSQSHFLTDQLYFWHLGHTGAGARGYHYVWSALLNKLDLDSLTEIQSNYLNLSESKWIVVKEIKKYRVGV